ncbi:MAG: hypothetical protein WAX44_00405 [Minisyncoccia bacterium]
MAAATKIYELYYHERQCNNSWVNGEDLEKYLRKEKPEVFQSSLDSELVKGWIAHPETYPEEFRKIHPCLWGSAHHKKLVYPSGTYRFVYCLSWSVGGEVVVKGRFVNEPFYHDCPALVVT